jgi:hypothetical protein
LAYAPVAIDPRVAHLRAAALMVVAGRFLAGRRRRDFCIVIAALACAITPFGTVLGVFTLVVPMRPSVQAMLETP